MHQNVVEFQTMWKDSTCDEDVRKLLSIEMMDEMLGSGMSAVDVHAAISPIDGGKYSTPWLALQKPAQVDPALDEEDQELGKKTNRVLAFFTKYNMAIAFAIALAGVFLFRSSVYSFLAWGLSFLDWKVATVAAAILAIGICIWFLTSSLFDRGSLRRSAIIGIVVSSAVLLCVWLYSVYSETSGGESMAAAQSETKAEVPALLPSTTTPTVPPPVASATQVVSFDWRQIPAKTLLAITQNSDAGVAACVSYKAIDLGRGPNSFNGEEWTVLCALVATSGLKASPEEILGEQSRLLGAYYGMSAGPGGVLQNVHPDCKTGFENCLIAAGRRPR